MSLVGGALNGLLPIGFSPDWGDSLDARARRWKLATDGRRKGVRLRVRGRLDGTLRLELPGGAIGKRLGVLLQPVLSGQDVWQSRVAEVKVGQTGALGFVVLGRPAEKRMAALGKEVSGR